MPYERKDKASLEWWEYDKLGTKASLGCIRLKVIDAKWIYNNCIPGTKVEFYSDTNPGPLGKPTAQKISEDIQVRNWDPTDPDKANPWPEYLKNKETKPTPTPTQNVSQTPTPSPSATESPKPTATLTPSPSVEPSPSMTPEN